MKSKNVTTRVGKYASYRKQIGRMKDIAGESLQDAFEPATIQEVKKNPLNTTTSLNAETILKEIELREDPTGEAKRQRERELKMTKMIKTITIVGTSLLTLTLLTVLFIFLYRRLS